MHEIELIKSFVIKDKRDRFIQLVSNIKRRKDFIKELGHFVKYIDIKYISRVEGVNQNSAFIHNFLTSHSVPDDCYVISENNILDQKCINLEDAIKATFGRRLGTFISCIPGELVYYEGEDERFFCLKSYTKKNGNRG